MKKSNHKEVQAFLENIQLMDQTNYQILASVRNYIFKVYPETYEKMMYGGIVFFMNEEMYSGLFVHKNHISLEFSNGFLMKDPNQQLEGKGKYRRHLKLKSKEDLENKNVKYYIKQAV